MKKYLIGFGLAISFFAGFSVVNAEWTPQFTKATNFNDCKYGKTEEINDLGEWITVPLSETPKDKKGRCLAVGESVNKEESPTGACDDLYFNAAKGNKEVKVKQLEENYQIVDLKKIEYKNGGYFVKNTETKVKCYKDNSSFKSSNLLKGKNPSTNESYTDTNGAPKTRENICLAAESDLRIKEIDFSRESDYEWYCPYSWDGSYPEGINPYDTKGEYFTKNLQSFYGFIPEENSELIHDCSRRMFALAKACSKRVERISSTADKIKKIRANFYTKQSVKLWKEMITATGLDAYDQWQEIKNMSFKEINEYTTSKDSLKIKKDAIAAVKAWNGFDSLKDKSVTPAKYFREEAEKKWDLASTTAKTVKDLLIKNIKTVWGKDPEKESDKNKLKNYMGGEYEETDFEFDVGEWKGSDSAKNKFKELLKAANEKKYSATLISKYISRRNNDLNVAVSVNQTSSINVSKILSAYDGSEETKLAAFNDKKDGKPLINVFDKIIRLAVRTMGTLAIFLLIISGVLMVVSQGDENQLEQAKTVFIYTLLGVVVGFLSYTIVRFVIDTLLS